MAKKIISILLVSIAMYSCTSNTIFKKPDDLIEEEKMIQILVDMELAIAAKSGNNIFDNHNFDYMPVVYEKYGIDSAQLSRSTYYYGSDIDNNNKLITEVYNRLTKIKERTDYLMSKGDSIYYSEQDIKKADSISVQ